MSSEKSNVFVVQETKRRDHSTGQLVPVHDLTPALVYGRIKILLPRHIGIAIQPAIHTLRRELKDFCDDDYLLLVGDPVAMSIAAFFAAEANQGRINMLRYDKKMHTYIHIPADLRRN